MNVHAKLSPSAAHRWIPRPGSVAASAGVPNKSSVFADEGTAAHTLAELCLRESIEAANFLGGHVNIRIGKVHRETLHSAFEPESLGLFHIDDEMVDAVQLYVDTVRTLVDPGDEVEYEAKLDLSHIPGMEFGTGDTTIYKPPSQRLIIVDLKYGRGVPVEAKGNPQTRIYALGVARRFHNRGVSQVECVIVQPRCPHVAGPVRYDTFTALDLVEFRMDVEVAALATMAPNAPLNPGEWCKFCPAAPTCPALRQKALATAEMEFAEEPPVVAEMSSEAMAAVLREAGTIKDWIKRVEERAHQMARDGTPPAGFKLVASRATRKWKDEDATVQYLGAVLDLTVDQIYAEPKVRSPAQIEAVIGRKRKDEIADLHHTPVSGKTILVPLEDARPPAKADAEGEFA